MNVESIMPLLAGLLALAISIVLFYIYYLRSRKNHFLLWGIGLLLWAVSDFTQLYAMLWNWSVLIYAFYYFSSVMLAGFLGAGTLFLISPNNKITKAYAWLNVAAALLLAIALAITPINTAVLMQNAVAGADAVSGMARALAVAVNIPAAITFIGGAAWSFIKTHKLYALLITIGALVPAVGGSLAAVAIPQLLPYTDFLGILFLGAGFYLSFASKHNNN